MSDNDNQKPTVQLDEHRGMSAQKATDVRRHKSGVQADQEALRQSQAAMEKHLFARPAETWSEAAERAAYLLQLLAATAEAQDPRLKHMIAEVTEDFRRLTAKPVS